MNNTNPQDKKKQNTSNQNKESNVIEDHPLHWADQMALEIKEKVENNKFLKDLVKKNGYFVYDEKTPSGHIHIGSGRGWIIHDVLAKALRNIGLKAKFVLSSDDFDPYDKPNKDLSNEWDKYLGMPFRNIPSPIKGYKSFGDYFFTESTNKFKEFGIECELASTGDDYIRGVFNKQIKIVLDNADKIKKIYEDLYSDEAVGANKIPWNPLCEKCGKIATTKVTKWDSKNEVVEYECTDDIVDYTKGCGYKGERSPYDGGGKFPWKVEWAAKWPAKGVIVETAGKDHFTEGGSRTTARIISDKIFDYPPPYPSTREENGFFYEFFTIGGAKMSTSKGKGIGFAESTNFAPAQILRYLLVRTRPGTVIDFDPYQTNDIILLYDRYDKTERIYFNTEESTEKSPISDKEKLQQKRIYELSHVGPIRKKIPIQIPFTQCSNMIQILGNIEDCIDYFKNENLIPKDANKDDIKYVIDRIEFAKNWISKYAPDQYVFKLNTEIPSNIVLSDKQKKALKEVLLNLKETKFSDYAPLHDLFKEIIAEFHMETSEFFSGAYRVLISKERGPHLANFVLMIGQYNVVKLLEKL